MKINVQHVAGLAKLKLSKAEEERFSSQLEDTLETIEQLNEVNTDTIEITSQVTGLENVVDQDAVHPSLTQKEALSNAKNTLNGFVVVKAVIEE
ncbi:MAG: Asp-tRNA(Asn)/Glu-tRNA(Gln) amidotransferase subunit GatC [Candidatus Parcubacteria bacterium]|jgi:aspartyl-tRNA(Asn)/glutamyl-tRNA(Gln) amidotransferase subunit C